MSSLDKLKELRQQLCKKKHETTVDCRQHLFEELTTLHSSMSADAGVPAEYTQKVSELLSVLNQPKSLEAENV
jgi:hypothetical protein